MFVFNQGWALHASLSERSVIEMCDAFTAFYLGDAKTVLNLKFGDG